MRRLLLASALIALPLAVQAAPLPIINFAGPLANDFVATNPTASTTHLAVSGATVTISGLFGNPGVTSGVMTLSADNTDSAVLVSGFAIQHYSGSFKITNAAGTVNYLSGTFTDAAFGAAGGDGLTVNVANPPESLTLASDVIAAADLVPPSAFDLSMSAVTPPLSIDAGQSIAAFTASYTGDASSSVQAIPEPGTLAVFGAGLVALGLLKLRWKGNAS